MNQVDKMVFAVTYALRYQENLNNPPGGGFGPVLPTDDKVVEWTKQRAVDAVEMGLHAVQQLHAIDKHMCDSYDDEVYGLYRELLSEDK